MNMRDLDPALVKRSLSPFQYVDSGSTFPTSQYWQSPNPKVWNMDYIFCYHHFSTLGLWKAAQINQFGTPAVAVIPPFHRTDAQADHHVPIPEGCLIIRQPKR